MAMIHSLDSRLAPYGLIVLGGFPVEAGDPPLPSGAPARFGALIGNAGPAMWRAFAAARRDEPHPLNAWNRRVVDPVAADLGATAVYPFDEPFLPFHRWAGRTGTIFASPMTPAIHPVYGTWFGLRGALFSAEPLADMPPPVAHPCESCVEKPCLDVCPADAIRTKDGGRCLDHLERHPESDCVAHACRARRACPVGREFAYRPDQARFHMEAFVRDFGDVMRKWRASTAGKSLDST
ncbi:conserved hypothetical protein [uncultured Alphaproteobacteria bacterium]|uniref:4Fe-4S ferredoxin-type domain-containing protein n=1 Tax=uncultured Alphaproteobacteria bacterium TaxID=91750 RepID=A0A212K1H0_9PROT|nr:conserved hypothetical protein [uncultured Alphaproteobacteria bacterium]